MDWLKAQVSAFAVFFAGDAVATYGIRLIAQQEWWAVPWSGVSALLWIWGVQMTARPKTTVAMTLGVMLGTQVGIWV